MRSFQLLLAYVVCFAYFGVAQRVEWDASNYPNPTAGDFKRCKMKTTASICDPDGVLGEQERYRLNHELHQLESRTRQDNAPDFCQKKGITAAMAVARHVRGGNTQTVKEMANSMLRKWSLDSQCQKSVVIVVAVDDKQFWVARDRMVPVYADEFNQIFSDQKGLFQEEKYQQALGNILQQTWEKAISKKTPIIGGGGGTGGDGGFGGRSQGGGGQPPSWDSGGSRGGSGSGMKMPSLPSIPIWVWIAIICVVIPLLCCCCFCYFCCCRGKGGSSPRRQQPSDMEGGGMGGGGGGGAGGGGRRSGLQGFLGGLGGAGIGSLAGRLLSGGGGGGGGRGMFSRGGSGPRGPQGPMDPGYQGGGAYPAEPYRPGAKPAASGGLYPSVAVDDEGGGGSWAK